MEPPSPSPTPRGPDRYLVMLLWAMTGGLFAILGAFLKESQHGGGLFVGVVIAPVVEEVLKPSGVYYLLERRVHWLTSRLMVAVLCAIGGVTFAAVENVIYLYLYFPEHEPGFAVWRWTVCIALHASCSFIVGLGLGNLLPKLRRGEHFEPEDCMGWLIAAMVLHGAYNAFAYFAAVTELPLW